MPEHFAQSAGSKEAGLLLSGNCPTGALVRVNPREYFSEAKNAIGIVFKDQTHAIGEHPPARRSGENLHTVGVFAVLAITSAVLWGARRYALDGHLQGTWLTIAVAYGNCSAWAALRPL